MEMIIYGAQGYALGAYEAIQRLYPNRRVLFFMVTFMVDNPHNLGGIPVRDIETVSKEFSEAIRKDVHVLIATPENVHEGIEQLLDEMGFCDHERLTSELWNELMRKLNSETGRFPSLEVFAKGEVKTPVYIYMAKSHKDKPLKNEVNIPEYMTPIQVGASNTEEVISDIRDNTGINISERNGNYCELTGLFWVWKNILCGRGNEDTYFGFAQYRRTLMISDEDLLKLGANSIDAVLPYPLPYEPDINMHHKRYIKDADWNALSNALRELEPEYVDAFSTILRQKYLYNYNVILAKKDVLREYCEWLFPILERTEELSVPKGSDRSDRYIGYMGETLETLYFMKNADKLKIVHTGCKLHV